MHHRPLLLGAALLSLNGLAGCAVTTSSTDAAVGQDVPTDTPASDLPVARDVVLPSDVPREDRVPPSDVPPSDVPREDRVPPSDVPVIFEDLPADIPVADAGTCRVEAPTIPPACGASVCGNGMRDSCMQCGPCGGGGGGGGGPGVDGGGPPPPPPWDAGTCCTTITEVCDGMDRGGATCESLGYRGGALACDGACGRDTRGCDACADTDTRGRCGSAPFASLDARDLALAVRGDRVALAWVEGGRHVGVALLNRDLGVVGINPCAGFPGARRVAMTHTSAGFLLAVETAEGVQLARLGGSEGLVTSGATISGGAAPILAEGPSGGALLVYTVADSRGATTYAVRATAEGAVTRTQARLFQSPTEPEYGSAAYTGDGWLVASRVNGVEVVRVNLDLSVGAARRLADTSTEYPQVAWDGARAALTWSSFGGPLSVRIAELDRDGALAGPVRTFTSEISSTRYFNVAPVARVGGDLAVLVGTHTGHTGHSGRIDLVRENAQPLMRVTTPHPVTRSPEQVTSYRVAALESTAVVAWIGTGTPRRIGLARLTP